MSKRDVKKIQGGRTEGGERKVEREGRNVKESEREKEIKRKREKILYSLDSTCRRPVRKQRYWSTSKPEMNQRESERETVLQSLVGRQTERFSGVPSISLSRVLNEVIKSHYLVF